LALCVYVINCSQEHVFFFKLLIVA
jgi:hypothetical protein